MVAPKESETHAGGLVVECMACHRPTPEREIKASEVEQDGKAVGWVMVCHKCLAKWGEMELLLGDRHRAIEERKKNP